jgi:hypothetical protein
MKSGFPDMPEKRLSLSDLALRQLKSPRKTKKAKKPVSSLSSPALSAK